MSFKRLAMLYVQLAVANYMLAQYLHKSTEMIIIFAEQQRKMMSKIKDAMASLL